MSIQFNSKRQKEFIEHKSGGRGDGNHENGREGHKGGILDGLYPVTPRLGRLESSESELSIIIEMAQAVQHFDLSSPTDEVLYGVVEAETGRQGGKPSDHELRNYAKYIGVRESEFEDFGRSLAEEGLSAPLPQGWEQGKTPEKGRRR